MNLFALLEKQIYSPLIVDSERAMSLRLFSRLALEWQLPEAQLRQGLNYFGIGEIDGTLLAAPSGGATPVVMTDASTPLNGANLNKYVNAEGKTSVKIKYGAIRWSVGTTFIVDSGYDSAGIVDANLVWEGTTTTFLDVNITGYTIKPLTIAGPNRVLATPSIVQFRTGNILFAQLYWTDFSGTILTVPDDTFSAAVIILGV